MAFNDVVALILRYFTEFV